jgi:hypothetical protein
VNLLRKLLVATYERHRLIKAPGFAPREAQRFIGSNRGRRALSSSAVDPNWIAYRDANLIISPETIIHAARSLMFLPTGLIKTRTHGVSEPMHDQSTESLFIWYRHLNLSAQWRLPSKDQQTLAVKPL